MYNLNTLMRNVLITPTEVIFHAPTKHTLDPRTIEQSIIIAEERFIRPELGNLYYSLCEEKNKEVTEGNLDQYADKFASYTLKSGDIINAYELLSVNNLQLWKQHLWKLIAECVMVIAFPEAYIQFGTAGVMHTVAPMSPMGGSGDVSPDLRSVKWMIDKKLQDRIDPLIQSLHNYLCAMRTTDALAFPFYTRECPCDGQQKEGKRTDLILNIYDDEINTCGCNDNKRRTYY